MDHCFVSLQCFEIVGCMTGRTSGGKTPTPLGYWTTRGYANSRIANSQTGHLADWTTRGCHRRLCVLSFLFGGICETASCPVRDLSIPRVGNPRVGVSASCPVTVPSMRYNFRESNDHQASTSHPFSRVICDRLCGVDRIQCTSLRVLG